MTYRVWIYSGAICHGSHCFDTYQQAAHYATRMEQCGYRCEIVNQI